MREQNALLCTPLDFMTPRWYAAYTCSRHEKKVAEQLRLRAVDFYLPIYTTVRFWNGRRARVDLPLFPGYVFVRLPLTERLRVLEVPGVVSLVGRNTGPLALPDADVESVRASLSISRQAEPHPYIGPGARVRIVSGTFAGLEGVVIRQSGRTRFVLSVDLIMRSIAVNVEAEDLLGVEPCSATEPTVWRSGNIHESDAAAVLRSARSAVRGDA